MLKTVKEICEKTDDILKGAYTKYWKQGFNKIDNIFVLFLRDIL